MFIENVMSIQESDPVWGRTFLSNDACYKYAIPAEFGSGRTSLFMFFSLHTQSFRD